MKGEELRDGSERGWRGKERRNQPRRNRLSGYMEPNQGAARRRGAKEEAVERFGERDETTAGERKMERIARKG